MAERMLIRNGIVLTQDPSLGELPRADVLVEGDTIAAVGPNLSAEGAEVIALPEYEERAKAPNRHLLG